MKRALTGAVITLLLACGEEATWPAALPATPAFDVAEVLLRPGDSLQVGVALIDLTGQAVATAPIVLVRDTQVATVSPDNTVFGHKMGTTWLVAALAGRVDSIPVTVAVRFVSVNVARNHACAVTDDGEAYCWGRNDFAKLMSGEVVSQPQPARVAHAGGVRMIAGGNNHACMLDLEGAPWCRGGGSMATPSAMDSAADPLSPARIMTAERFVEIRSGAGSTCGLTSGGAIWCWGANTYGEAGTGTAGGRIATPARAHSGHTFVQFDLGEHNGTCGLKADGMTFCWGHNDLYQLGREPLSHSLPAIDTLSGGHRWRSIELGPFNGCGVTVDGAGYCWGQKVILGTEVDTSAPGVSTPLPVAGNHHWRMIAVGHYTNCGLDGNGRAWCWGFTYRDGGQAFDTTPAALPTELRFTTVSAGSGYACGLATEGRVWCWGIGGLQLGRDATFAGSAEPVLIPFQLAPDQ